MGFALTPGEAPLHFSRSKNVMHVGGDAGEHVLIGLQCRRIWKCCYERALMGMVLP